MAVIIRKGTYRFLPGGVFVLQVGGCIFTEAVGNELRDGSLWLVCFSVGESGVRERICLLIDHSEMNSCIMFLAVCPSSLRPIKIVSKKVDNFEKKDVSIL